MTHDKALPRTIVAGVCYFALIFSLGFILGVARNAILISNPGVGRMVGVAVELPIMLLACWIASGWLIRRFNVPATPSSRLTMGGLGFIMMVFAELSVGIALFDRSIAEHVALYAMPSYLAGLIAQILFALFPVLRLSTS